MILATKLFKPLPAPLHLQRNRLFDRLDSGGRSGLSIIVAPAGYGKTTVVAAWLAQHHNQAACWLSLDERDNDGQQFWQYVIATLQTVEPQLGKSAEKSLRLPESSKLEDVVQALTNDLWQAYTQSGKQLVLVLDDFHLINTPSVHQSLGFLLDNLPASALHIVITTRSHPPLNLARRRARQQLTEIGQDELRFSLDELTIILNDHLRFALPNATVRAIHRQTEGWIAAIQLLVLSLQRQNGQLVEQTHFFDALAQSKRFITDYLIEEVLGSLSAEMRRFLQHTTPLQEFSADLLHQLLPDQPVEAHLTQLERDNLFLIPLDAAHTRFRYHHLFATLVQSHLSLTATQRQQLLHSASLWHAGQAEWPLAIDYAQQLSAHDLVATHMLTIVEQHPNQDELRSGWFEQLPVELFDEQPKLHLIYALKLVFIPEQNALDKAKQQITLAENKLAGKPLAPYWRALLLYCTAYVHWKHSDYDEQRNVSLCLNALDNLRDTDAFLKGRCYHLLATLYLNHHHHEQGTQVAQQAERFASSAGDEYVIILSKIVQWRFSPDGSSPRQLVRRTTAFLESCSPNLRHNPMIAAVHNLHAASLIALGQTEAALAPLRDALRLIMLTSDYVHELAVRLNLVMVLSRLGFDEEALGVVAAVPQRAQLVDWLADNQRRLILHWQYPHNKTISAELNHWADNSEHLLTQAPDVSMNLVFVAYVYDLTIFGRVAMWREDKAMLRKTCDRIDWVLNTYQALGPYGVLPSLHFNRACFATALGQPEQAIEHTRTAVNMAKTLDNCAPITASRSLGLPLLQTLITHDGPTPWLNQLVAIIEADNALRRANRGSVLRQSQTSSAENNTLLDPLTNRELEILSLIATGQSNKEIAAHLVLSPNTVRVHASNIYQKLGASSRNQATHKARELGIIA